jgi:hypothetical protein
MLSFVAIGFAQRLKGASEFSDRKRVCRCKGRVIRLSELVSKTPISSDKHWDWQVFHAQS